MDILNWSLNWKVLPGLKDNIVGSSQVQNDQINFTQNMSMPGTQRTPQNMLVQITLVLKKNTVNSIHCYSLHHQMPICILNN